MKKTKLVGILNVTPDSFYDGKKHDSIEKAIEHGKMLSLQGADLIDVGGESTRPFADKVSESDELARVIPVITALKQEIDTPLSIDTMKPKVAEKALLAGASIINDVSGFSDPTMIKLAVDSQSSIIAMHMNGSPQTMQNDPVYKNGVLSDIEQFFKQRIDELLSAGVNPSRIILDPGVGFGKTVDDNLEILQNLQNFRRIGFPLLIGHSRKSFIGKILNREVQERLSGTLAISALCVINNVDYIRVHDVLEHRDAIDMITAVAR